MDVDEERCDVLRCIWTWLDWPPQEAVQTLRLPALWGGEGAVPLPFALSQCCWLLLLHQCLHHHQWVFHQLHITSDLWPPTAMLFLNKRNVLRREALGDWKQQIMLLNMSHINVYFYELYIYTHTYKRILELKLCVSSISMKRGRVVVYNEVVLFIMAWHQTPGKPFSPPAPPTEALQ